MAKKKSTATAKDLRKQVTELGRKVDRAERKADRWKARATRAEAASKKADKKLAKLSRKRDRTGATGPAQVVQSDPLAVASARPDDTWTVVALRGEARSQGLTGFSRMSKADLLAALR